MCLTKIITNTQSPIHRLFIHIYCIHDVFTTSTVTVGFLHDVSGADEVHRNKTPALLQNSVTPFMCWKEETVLVHFLFFAVVVYFSYSMCKNDDRIMFWIKIFDDDTSHSESQFTLAPRCKSLLVQ